MWAQNSPQALTFELLFGTENVPSQNQLTFTVGSQGPIWNSSFDLTSDYPGNSVTTWGSTYPNFLAGFDFVLSISGNLCQTVCGSSCCSTCCYGGVLSFGVYKVTCSDGGYFYLDYSDDDYGGSVYNYDLDIFLKYDDGENQFYWSSAHTGGGGGTYSKITNGSTIGVWTMWGFSNPQDQSKFQPTTPTNLQVTWNSDYTHPLLQWNKSTPSVALYNIYRRTRFGSYQQIASNYGNSSYVDTQISCGNQTYYYKVIAVSGDQSKQSPGYVEKSFLATCPQIINDKETTGQSGGRMGNLLSKLSSVVGSPPRSAMGMYSSWIEIQPNNLRGFLSNAGLIFQDNTGGEMGLSWVSQDNGNLVFTSGLWIAGIDEQRIARSAYNLYYTSFQPGVITHPFSDTNISAASNVLDPRFEIAVVSDTSTPSETSYQRWVQNANVTGAPINEDGSPKLFGKVNAYWVMNDLDTTYRFSRPPMGVEVHCYVFGIDTTGVLSDAMFIMMDIINKSVHTYDSTYSGWFSDIDLGDANDDLSGCDTLLSLGYMYNGKDSDAVYGKAPPACGFVMLYSPARTESNSPMCSFNKDNSGTFWSLFPPPDSPLFSRLLINDLSGKHRDGSPFINPNDSAHTITYVDPGDPVSRSGWIAIQDVGPTPSDNRLLQGSGPFTFAPGDTQQFVVAFIAARDTSRLSSITKLKEAVPAIVSKWNEVKSILVNVSGSKSPVPTDFSMSQNYPNPFNPSTVIRYKLPTNAFVTLKIYDVLGRQVLILVSEHERSGNHSVTFDASNLPSGVYFYRLQAGNYSQTRKLLLLK